MCELLNMLTHTHSVKMSEAAVELPEQLGTFPTNEKQRARKGPTDHFSPSSPFLAPRRKEQDPNHDGQRWGRRKRAPLKGNVNYVAAACWMKNTGGWFETRTAACGFRDAGSDAGDPVPVPLPASLRLQTVDGGL